ncbi:MAG TPA: cupin domain-containing protein [Candidatus Saccharimonadales bacterium]|nr:cupin domain-containing protein [Candidatus Saccharimonadales bacterium]
MRGYKANVEHLTLENNNFREVLYTAEHSQLVLMNLLPNEEIGEEVHTVDQFFRFEKGDGKTVLDGVEQIVGDGDVVIVPAGTRHNVINTSATEPLKLYTIYSPPNHRDRVIHATKAQGEADQTDKFEGKTSE